MSLESILTSAGLPPEHPPLWCPGCPEPEEVLSPVVDVSVWISGALIGAVILAVVAAAVAIVVHLLRQQGTSGPHHA